MMTDEIGYRLDVIENNIHCIRKQIAEHRKKEERLTKSVDDGLLDRLRGVVESMGIIWATIVSGSRFGTEVFYARCMVAKELRKAGYSLNAIGGVLNRDHSTVCYYMRQYQEVKANQCMDRRFAEFIRDFENRLNNTQK